MRFLLPALEVEFREYLHPEARAAIDELDDWSLENAVPQVVVVGLGRTPARNAEVNGKANSWHLYRCAGDLRNSHYSPVQRTAVWAWLRRRCPKPLWELLDHNAGSGPHFHLARRDFFWRTRVTLDA